MFFLYIMLLLLAQNTQKNISSSQDSMLFHWGKFEAVFESNTNYRESIIKQNSQHHYRIYKWILVR